MKVKTASRKIFIEPLLWLSGSLLLLVLISGYFQNSNEDIVAKYPTISSSELAGRGEMKTLGEVLDAYPDRTIMLSIKDEAANKFPAAYRKRLGNMGGKQIEDLKFRSSYVGLLKNGKFVREDSQGDAPVTLNYRDMTMVSAGGLAGSFAHFKVGREKMQLEKRGLNVLVLNEQEDLERIYSFDFYVEEEPRSFAWFWNPVYESLEKIELEIDEKAFQKLEAKRKKALKGKVLMVGEEDLVNAQVIYKDQSYKSQIRLKGDWTDHLVGDKWSFRVKLEDKEKALRGMQNFSLQQPSTRNYAGEWLYHRILKEEGLLNLKYDFVQFFLTVKGKNGKQTKNLGVYALEEFFEKQVIERNERRAGVLIKFDEDPLWKYRADFIGDGINAEAIERFGVITYDQLPILPFSEKQVRKDSNLLKQFNVGKTLLEGYIKGERLISEVFDVPLLAKFNAICNILGGDHSLIEHNYRFYYNPITTRLEPVGFDAYAGLKVGYPGAYRYANNDLNYLSAYVSALEEVTSDAFYKKLIEYPQLAETVALLEGAFMEYEWSEEVFLFNRRVILGLIDPVRCLNVFLEKIEDQTIYLSVENFGRFPVVVNSVLSDGQRVLGAVPEEQQIVRSNERKLISIPLEQNFERLFVDKKKKKSGFDWQTDIDRVQLSYQILGASKNKLSNIFPWKAGNEQLAKGDVLRKSANVENYKFLTIDETSKTISCRPGQWQLKEELIIPEGYTFYLSGDSKIETTTYRGKIISYSPVKFIGTPDQPVEIFAGDLAGQGLLVMNTKDTSILEYCKFSGLGNPYTGTWVVTGAVNFYNAPVIISNTVFEKNRSEDGLNIIKTTFSMKNVAFKATRSDAFDGDFVKGEIIDCTFSDIGNDAIDVSGSDLWIQNVLIKNAGDKGLSAGENSTMKADQVTITDCEIAVASKDKSLVQVKNLYLHNNELGFTAFQKKPEFGPAQIEAELVESKSNVLEYLIENQSALRLEGQYVPTVDRVKEQMYGVIYGKSSK